MHRDNLFSTTYSTQHLGLFPFKNQTMLLLFHAHHAYSIPRRCGGVCYPTHLSAMMVDGRFSPFSTFYIIISFYY